MMAKKAKMAKQLYIRHDDNVDQYDDQFNIGTNRAYSLDYSPWADSNGAITGVTWAVKSGTATITNQAFSSNIATAQISAHAEGMNYIEITASTGEEKNIFFLSIYARGLSKDLDYL